MLAENRAVIPIKEYTLDPKQEEAQDMRVIDRYTFPALTQG